MADLLSISTGVIDGTTASDEVGPLNRINFQLSEIGDGIAMVEAFSHCILFKTDDGLVAFDTSSVNGGERVVSAIRGWSKERFNSLIYTHGHIDHVGGCGFFVEDAANNRHDVPNVIGHKNVSERFDRYNKTSGYNLAINQRQFGQFSRRGYDIADGHIFLNPKSPKPNLTYSDQLELTIGGTEIELKHAKGETDDHTWAWIPKHKAICAGDFFIWNFPNAGNPQKVQRFPVEWATALRAMSRQDAELFLPAHGLPIEGKERIRRVLNEVADALEFLVEETVQRMNEGARLDEIIQEIKIDPAILEKPYLRPTYDEPEFVIRNIWRLYGGWWDGNPSRLKPAPDGTLARELANLAGGALKMAERAQELIESDIRLACHLVEMAAQAAPSNTDIHIIRAEVYQYRRNTETSLMAKGIYGSAAGESQSQIEE